MAVGLSNRLVGRLTDRVAELIHRAGLPPVILLDDVHRVRDRAIHALLEGLLSRERLAFTLVCAWRSDELGSYPESGKLRSALDAAARQRSPSAGARIHLAGLESAELVGQFFERRGLAKFLTPDVRLGEFVKSPPGDLAELANQLCAGTVERIDRWLFKPDQGNSLRWERLRDFQDDLRVISVAQDWAPEKILLHVARKLSISLRLRSLDEMGVSIQVRRVSGVWYRLYPDQFSDYVYTTHLSSEHRNRLQSALMSAGLASLRASEDPEIAGLLMQVAARSDDIQAPINWSVKLGRAALRHGWINTSLRAFGPFMERADYRTLSEGRIEVLLDCVDLLRQSGDRESALRLLTRAERRCCMSPAQTIRAACLRIRLARDLKGGEAARRIARRLIRVSPDVLRSYEFLNQLARAERDTGKIKAGLQHANDAGKAVTKAGNSRRAQATKAEILYTAGSIERLASMYATATSSLADSATLRARREDNQGRAYALLELAMCALVQNREDEAANFLAEATSLSGQEEISDRRASAYAHTVASCLALRRGDLTLAKDQQAQAAKWTSTREQGIRGNPHLIEAVLFARSRRTTDAANILKPLLSSNDRTVQATAALILAAVMPQRRTELTMKARVLATRNGFSLEGVGAELLVRLSVPIA